MLIDAHQHFWTIGAAGQSWPGPDLPALYRDFGPGDLEDAARNCDLSGTVLVQAQPSDADTDWLLALADQTPLVLGVVGWADLLAADAPKRIASLARHPKFRGLRPMLQDMADSDWIADPLLDPAIDAMVAHRVTLDALVRPRHLPALARLAARWPDLGIVIDHAAKPAITDHGAFVAWANDMRAVAAHSNVFCKLSGLVTEAPQATPAHVFQPVADHLLACFGAARLMWGSDWPVVNLRCSYREWYDLAATLLGTRPADTEAIMAETAIAFYRLRGLM